MSSIAYITDQNMIEYHRLHGNTEILFWRPSSQKKFGSFQIGDYLFFLTKGTEKGKQREKGIVGYGRFTKEEFKPIHEVWRKYKSNTGYANEQKFQEAVKRVCKQDQLPEKIHCLTLQNVIFFQSPVYLSEVDKIISKQVESYVYLDQETPYTSWNILNKASEYGTDMWATLVENTTYKMKRDASLLLIQNVYHEIPEPAYTEYEKQKVRQFMKSIKKTAIQEAVYGRYDVFVQCHEEDTICFLPVLCSLKSWKQHFIEQLGCYSLLQGAFASTASGSVQLIFYGTPPVSILTLCEQARINYEIVHIQDNK